MGMGVEYFFVGKASEEVAAVCYSYKDREVREEARRKAERKRGQRGRREERAKEAGGPAAGKDRELVRA